MRCQEQGCNGTVEGNKRILKLRDGSVRDIRTCDTCGRVYDKHKAPINEGNSGYFVENGVVVTKTSTIPVKGE